MAHRTCEKSKAPSAVQLSSFIHPRPMLDMSFQILAFFIMDPTTRPPMEGPHSRQT